MKQYIIGALAGAVLSTGFYVYQFAQSGAVKVSFSIDISKESLDKINAAFNPATSVNLELGNGLNFACPGKDANTCKLTFISVD
jgi:hypothetical protein